MVEVTDNEVTGWLETPDTDKQKYGREPFLSGERVLRRRTIEVLRSWLNRWTALTRASEQGKYEHFIVGDTFAVSDSICTPLSFSARSRTDLKRPARQP